MVVAARHDISQVKLPLNKGFLTSPEIDWLKPFPNTTPPEILREEIEKHGVVWVKNAMPRDYVLDVRRKFFERLAHSGVLKEGSDPVDGIYGDRDPNEFIWPWTSDMSQFKPEDYTPVMAKIHHEDWTNQFAGNEHMIKLVHDMYPEWKRPGVLRRQIFRSVMPNTDTATGVHYDQIFLRYGPPTAVTAWIPVGDCSLYQGGLIYLEDSLPVGKKYEEDFVEMCKAKNMTEDERRNAYNSNMTDTTGVNWNPIDFAKEKGGNRKWLIGDYEAGDAVFHQMHTVHASGTNRDPENKIRFSADVRYVDEEQDYDHRWTKPFTPGDGL